MCLLTLRKIVNYIREIESIKLCIELGGNTVCYTYTSPLDNGTNIIDNVLLNDRLFDHMLEYYNMHDGSNLSFNFSFGAYPEFRY